MASEIPNASGAVLDWQGFQQQDEAMDKRKKAEFEERKKAEREGRVKPDKHVQIYHSNWVQTKIDNQGERKVIAATKEKLTFD